MPNYCKYCGKEVDPGQVCVECTLTDLSAASLLSLRGRSTQRANVPHLLESSSGKRHTIEGAKWKIGRDPTNQLVIDVDPYTSRFHAWITCEDGHYYLEDLGSTNGTLHNGEPVMRRRTLVNGDRVRIGRSDFTFVREMQSETVKSAGSTANKAPQSGT